MVQSKFKCKQCGNCCKNLVDAYSTTVPESDIRMWKENNRKDILQWVKTIKVGNEILAHDIWFNPKTGEETESCPWLRYDSKRRVYRCAIHLVKPTLCKEYPHDKEHALETGCKGFE